MKRALNNIFTFMFVSLLIFSLADLNHVDATDAAKTFKVGETYYFNDAIDISEMTYIQVDDQNGTTYYFNANQTIVLSDELEYNFGQWIFEFKPNEYRSQELPVRIGYNTTSGQEDVAGFKCKGGTGVSDDPFTFELVFNYHISFDSNGGTGSMQEVELLQESEYDLPECTYNAPEDHEFDHWQVQIGTDTPVDKNAGDPIVVSDDVALKAIWKQLVSHDIVVDDSIQYGSITASKTSAKKGETVSLEANPVEGSKLISYTVKDVDGGTITVNEDNTFIMPDKKVTVTGEFGPEIEYNVTVGSIRANSLNKDDILNDGGKAKYIPSDNTLVLNNPDLGTDLDRGIYAENQDLIIRGDVNLLSSRYGILVNYGSLTIEGGNITVNVKSGDSVYGIWATSSLNIKSGTITVIGESTGGVLDDATGLISTNINIEGGTINANMVNSYHSRGFQGNTTIKSGDVTIISKGIYSDGIINGNFVMSGGELHINSESEDYGTGIYADYGRTISITGGELVVENKSDGSILSGSAINSSGGISISGGKITAKTKAKGIGTSAITLYDAGPGSKIIISGGEINAEADGTDASGIYTDQSISLIGGNIVSKATDIGISSHGKITIGNTVESVSAKGTESGIYSLDKIELGDELTIKKPVNGRIKDDKKTIIDNGGNHSGDVLIANDHNYKITVNETENGTVSSNRTKANNGEVVALTADPDENCKLTSISVKDKNENNITLTETETGYTFVMPESDVTITAIFTRYYDIKITESSEQFVDIEIKSAAAGDLVNIKLKDVKGYEIRGVKVTDSEGKSIKVNEDNSFRMPASKVTIEVDFAKIYTLTFDLDGGLYDGKNTYTVDLSEGTTIKMPRPVKKGYTFDYWQGSKYYAGESYTITENHNFKAVWKKDPVPDSYVIPMTGIE